MNFSINATEKTVKKALANAAKGITIDDVVDWKANTWSNLIAIVAGLKPFSGSATLIIPEVFRPFLPRIDFIPTPKDKQNAAQALRNALYHVNSAITETTKMAYGSVLQSAIGPLLGTLQQSIPGGIDQFLGELQNELNNYDMRKLYFQTGLAMMSDEQAWLGKHHTFAVGVLNIYDADPSRVLTDEEYFSFAYDLGMLDNGVITFNPMNQSKKSLTPDQMMSALTQTLTQACETGQAPNILNQNIQNENQ
jgi:hypothetical protein